MMQTQANGTYCWVAIRVKSRGEKLAAATLEAKGIEVFAAVAPQRRVWADRIRVVEMPLFPGYIFGRIDLTRKRDVEDCAGVASIVSIGGKCCAVEEREVDGLRKLAASGAEVQRSPYLRVGAAIRVKHGPLESVEGLLVQIRNQFRLVVSVTLLQRSVEVEIDEAMVEPIHRGRPPLAEVA